MNLRTPIILFISVLALAATPTPVLARPAAIDWSSIDCGGSTSTGGVFILSGTIGQPDAGTPLTGGAFTLNGGFRAFAPCRADFNGSGTVTPQDIFDFLAAYFANAPGSDFNLSGSRTPQDIFDFLSAYFAACP